MIKARILVVEDEPSLQKSIAFVLKKEGYQVQVASDGEEGWKEFSQNRPDLALLDLMLPKMDGLELCRLFRQEDASRGKPSLPILMLTAKGETSDKVKGLKAGADDYLTKPFALEELLARVEALLRRSQPQSVAKEFRTGPLAVDLEERKVSLHGKPVELTFKEFKLLETLMSFPNKVFSRDQLLDDVWGVDFFGDARTVDVHIRRLREKIEPDPSSPSFIKTVKGFGYKFEPPAA